MQSVRRNDESSRWDGQLLLSIRGTPWQPMPGQEAGAELPEPLPLVPEQPEVLARPAEPFHRTLGLRRLYITRRDLERHGYTAGCPACGATRAGNRGQALLTQKRAESAWKQPFKATQRGVNGSNELNNDKTR